MISGIPNMAYVFGYFRHSWTLRVDLVSDLVIRLMEHMQVRTPPWSSRRCAPRTPHAARPWSDPENFNAGYVMRSQHAPVQAGRPRAVDPHAGARRGAEILPKADLDDGSSSTS